MRPSLIVLASLALFLAGCGEKSGPPAAGTNAPASPGGTTASPVGHLKAAVDAHQDMVKTVDLTAFNKAIELFQVQEGRLPKDLDELASMKYIPVVPRPPEGMSLRYNATKGVVTLEKL